MVRGTSRLFADCRIKLFSAVNRRIRAQQQFFIGSFRPLRGELLDLTVSERIAA